LEESKHHGHKGEEAGEQGVDPVHPSKRVAQVSGEGYHYLPGHLEFLLKLDEVLLLVSKEAHADLILLHSSDD